MSTAIASTLALQIREEHEAAETAFASAVEHAIRCGHLLGEAKAQVPHGAWLPWLDEHFPASKRTAQGYMRLAKHAENAQALAHLGVEGALRELAAPQFREYERALLDDQRKIALLTRRLDAIDDPDEQLAAAALVVDEARQGGREAAARRQRFERHLDQHTAQGDHRSGYQP